MTTSFVNLEALTTEFPAQKAGVEKLLTYFESVARTATRDKFFSYNRISAISEIYSTQELVMVLARLVQSGLLEQIIRVENESAGIGDFPSIAEVPDTIFDDRTETLVRVTPDKLHLYYKLQPQS